jgi:hypothetical protein
MGAGLLAVKSGFILFIKIYSFYTINTLEREKVSTPPCACTYVIV